MSVDVLGSSTNDATVSSVALSQDVSSKTDDSGVLCKKNYNEFRSSIVREDFRVCTVKYINNFFKLKQVKRTDKDKRDFLIFINDQFKDQYFIEETKAAELHFFLKQDLFSPGKSVNTLIEKFISNQQYKDLTVKSIDAKYRASIIKNGVALIDGVTVKEVSNIYSEKKLEDAIFFKEKLINRIVKNNDGYNFTDNHVLIKQLKSLFEKSITIFELKLILYEAAIAFYSGDVNNFKEVIDFIGLVRESFPLRKRYSLVLEAISMYVFKRYEKCISVASNMVADRIVKSILSSYKDYCMLEIRKISPEEILKKKKLISLKASNDFEVQYIAEILIAANRLSEAEGILNRTNSVASDLRIADLLVVKQSYDQALKLIERVIKKEEGKKTLRNFLRVFLINYLKKNEVEYNKMLPDLVKGCDNYLQLASNKFRITVDSCEVAKKVYAKETRQKIKEFLERSNAFQSMIFRKQILESVRDQL